MFRPGNASIRYENTPLREWNRSKGDILKGTYPMETSKKKKKKESKGKKDE